MIVLIIEDDEAMTQIWTHFLTGVAASVRVAHTLEEGIRLMREEPHPNVVLLDLGLPGSFPRKTLEHIATLKAVNPLAVVIVITGNVEKQMPEIAAALGADNFSRKPEEANSKLALLTSILKGVETARRRNEPVYARPLEIYEYLTSKLNALAH